MKRVDALVTPETLEWARRSAGLELEDAATRLRIKSERLAAWEKGAAAPSFKQLIRIAHLYDQPVSAFYLPKAPEVFRPPLKDYRRHPTGDAPSVSFELHLDVRRAIERREVLLDLLQESGERIQQFKAQLSPGASAEVVGGQIRGLLGIDSATQQSWRQPEVAFREARALIEKAGVLAFQTSDVPLDEMRGYSLALFPMPVVVVNRKDAYSGRTFTLMHEVAHLILHAGGICIPSAFNDRPQVQAQTETFCNYVAGSALIPAAELLAQPVVESHREEEWDDEDLTALARTFAVSREVVLRRLLITGRTTQAFYVRWVQERHAKAASKAGSKPGFVHPAVNSISLNGRKFVRTVLSALGRSEIPPNVASEYLGVRAKHFDRMRLALAP